MCGIVGAISWNEKEDVNVLLDRMQAAQKHRGPDHQGIWAEGPVGLANARLSILDLSSLGNQPMLSNDGRFILVYNGEIYNHLQLRESLIKAGDVFRSSSDTETLLAGLARHGQPFIEELDGMFAFAFFDRQTKKLLLARDRCGIKPLYYYQSAGVFLFASEIKSIAAALPASGLKLNRAGMQDLFSPGYPCGASTSFEGINSLVPGVKMEISAGNKECKQVFFKNILDAIQPSLWQKRNSQPSGEIENELESQIKRSVKAHLISNAPVGVVCSGGVDSSLIAAIAKETLPNIALYHASVPGEAGEEVHARKVANHLGLDLQIAKLTRENFLENWPRAVYHNDFPSYHPNDVPFFLVSRLAAGQGIKVLLSGEGADELFGGYWVNHELSRREFFSKLFKKIPSRFRAVLSSASEAWIGKEDQDGFWNTAFGAAGSASRGRIRSILKKDLLHQGSGQRLSKLIEIQERLSFLPKEEQAGAGYLTERMFGHLGSLLHRNDRMGMMASIETRIPYLSNELIASWTGMPLRFKIKNGHYSGLKYLLKKIAARYLPLEIVKRPKMGFSVPLGTLLKPNPVIFKDGFLEDYLRIPFKVFEKIYQNPQDYYKGASIEIWGRIFFRKEIPDHLSAWVLKNC